MKSTKHNSRRTIFRLLLLPFYFPFSFVRHQRIYDCYCIRVCRKQTVYITHIVDRDNERNEFNYIHYNFFSLSLSISLCLAGYVSRFVTAHICYVLCDLFLAFSRIQISLPFTFTMLRSLAYDFCCSSCLLYVSIVCA